VSVAIGPDLYDAIRRCVDGIPLSAQETEHVVGLILDGAATHAQIAALLVGLARSGETVDELIGAARAMQARSLPVQSTRTPLLDVCGTGGDHSGTFNISTATALVVAGAGIAVAKHGNRAMSSHCGSADVVEALGGDLQVTPACAERALETAGIAFLYAQRFHPSLRAVSPVRREIGIRTLFNLIGPLCNPASPTHQLVGVPDRRLLPIVAEVLVALGRRRAAVVCADDGMDELSVTGPSQVVEWTGTDLRAYEIRPEMIGALRHDRAALAGAEPDANAAIIRQVLTGVQGPHRDVVVLNAALALQVAGAAPDLAAGAELARASIDGGRAARSLAALVGAPR
jgi:anthranilate phosphoribosyltransferase